MASITDKDVCHAHRVIPKLLIIAFCLFGCKKIEDELDPFGHYDKCYIKAASSNVEGDVRRAIRSNDLRFFWNHTSGYSVGSYAPGLRECLPKEFSTPEQVEPFQVDPKTQGFPDSPAGKCVFMLKKYKINYNLRMKELSTEANNKYCGE